MNEIEIDVNNILVKETVQDSEEIIRKLGELLYYNEYVKDTYTQAVIDREKVFPTGLQTTILGCAIPHTDTIHVIHSSIAIATLTSEVIFKAMGEPEVDIPVTLVIMLAVSDVNLVVDTLTKVISILEDEPALKNIMRATKKEEIQETMQEHLRKVSEQNAASAVNVNIGH